ncbi:helix-hairpin-helix domain-containing protein [Jannaschia seohaensis]|uniref:Helix-hairpin-helix domain-containing protein n=1 Tax=Jannaschia seohaensis TaxID=475081 RepID=A0A2Y9AQD5_9RHOB|nr:helix-hairpin-helix domain-containing protein [Jannaschia seohaensis]PWJ20581.1 helix-hairpin-helix protein [Jannaschia seohaensis]SSA44677.1 Helix-hairpin-helix domain-containing protein [Jannaschia seohaensis]
MSDEMAPKVPSVSAEDGLIAARLDEYADLIEVQGADGFRVRAYRNAAREIGALPEPLRKIFDRGGTRALVDLPGIGKGIAAAIVEMLTTGHWRQLDRLKGTLTPEALFRTIPGIGEELARRLVDTLDVESLEDLETALRLGDTPVPGIGPRRRAAILATLDQRLARLRREAGPASAPGAPPISLLLDADALYRAKAEAGELRRIAPKRFNPTGEAWLPILHARRGDWHLTVLYSNTAQAHDLGRTQDWVVIYFHQDDHPEGRATVVTERQGPLAGKRVVRGREDECRRYYVATDEGSAPTPADGSPA